MPLNNPNLLKFQRVYKQLSEEFYNTYIDKDKRSVSFIINRIKEYYKNTGAYRSNIFIIHGESCSGKTFLLNTIFQKLRKLEIDIDDNLTINPKVKNFDITKLIIERFDKDSLNDQIVEEENTLDIWYKDFLSQNSDIEIFCMDNLELLLSVYQKHNQINNFVNKTIYFSRIYQVFSEHLENFKRIFIIVIPSNFSSLNLDVFPTVVEVMEFNKEEIQNRLLLFNEISVENISNPTLVEIIKTYKSV